MCEIIYDARYLNARSWTSQFTVCFITIEEYLRHDTMMFEWHFHSTLQIV